MDHAVFQVHRPFHPFAKATSLRWNVICDSQPSPSVGFHRPFKAQCSYQSSWAVFPNHPQAQCSPLSKSLMHSVQLVCHLITIILVAFGCGCWIVLLLICVSWAAPFFPLPLFLLSSVQGILQKVWWAIEWIPSHWQFFLIRTFR